MARLAQFDHTDIIEGDRINEGHVGVRFNDHLYHPHWKIFLKEQEVTKWCYEAVPGDQGAVIMVTGSGWALVTGPVSVVRLLE